MSNNSIVKILDRNQGNRVILVPGELGNAQNYHLPDLARWFPNRDVVVPTNAMSKFVSALTSTAQYILEGNHDVCTLAQQAPGRIPQFYKVLI